MINLYNLIEKNSNEFTSNDKIVALAIIESPEKFLELDITELSKFLCISPPSITRFCKKIGIEGFKELKFILIESIKVNKEENNNIKGEVHLTYEKLLTKFSNKFNNSIYLKASSLITNANNVHIIGIGSSGLVAKDFSIRLSRLGISSKAITDSDFMVMESQLSNKKDIFIAFSSKGITHSINDSIIRCKKNDVPVILITENTTSALTLEVDLFISLPPTQNIDPSISPNFTQLLVADTIINYLVKENPKYISNYKKTLSVYKKLVQKKID